MCGSKSTPAALGDFVVSVEYFTQLACSAQMLTNWPRLPNWSGVLPDWPEFLVGHAWGFRRDPIRLTISGPCLCTASSQVSGPGRVGQICCAAENPRLNTLARSKPAGWNRPAWGNRPPRQETAPCSRPHLAPSDFTQLARSFLDRKYIYFKI